MQENKRQEVSREEMQKAMNVAYQDIKRTLKGYSKNALIRLVIHQINQLSAALEQLREVRNLVDKEVLKQFDELQASEGGLEK